MFALRHPLESSLVTHIVVQMPLLALSGWLFAGSSRPDIAPGHFNSGGATGLTLALFIFAFWMLPRSVDGAVQTVAIEAAKFTTLPLAGAALAKSWPRLPVLAVAIVKANTISMLLFLGWFYSASPFRLCNNYLRSDQDVLGAAMILVATLLALAWAAKAMIGLDVSAKSNA